MNERVPRKEEIRHGVHRRKTRAILDLKRYAHM